MTRPKLVFLGFALLALAWTGVLTWLALTAADPIVVSAPQLHLSLLVVAAEVKPAGKDEVEAKIVKVFKNESRLGPGLPGTIHVQWNASYEVPGVTTYLLALVPAPGPPEQLTYDITPLGRRADRQPDLRVYPYTDSVRIQVERILAK